MSTSYHTDGGQTAHDRTSHIADEHIRAGIETWQESRRTDAPTVEAVREDLAELQRRLEGELGQLLTRVQADPSRLLGDTGSAIAVQTPLAADWLPVGLGLPVEQARAELLVAVHQQVAQAMPGRASAAMALVVALPSDMPSGIDAPQARAVVHGLTKERDLTGAEAFAWYLAETRGLSPAAIADTYGLTPERVETLLNAAARKRI